MSLTLALGLPWTYIPMKLSTSMVQLYIKHDLHKEQFLICLCMYTCFDLKNVTLIRTFQLTTNEACQYLTHLWFQCAIVSYFRFRNSILMELRVWRQSPKIMEQVIIDIFLFLFIHPPVIVKSNPNDTFWMFNSSPVPIGHSACYKWIS